MSGIRLMVPADCCRGEDGARLDRTTRDCLSSSNNIFRDSLEKWFSTGVMSGPTFALERGAVTLKVLNDCIFPIKLLLNRYLMSVKMINPQ